MQYSDFVNAIKVSEEILGDAACGVETGLETIKISVNERGWPANIGMTNEHKLNEVGWTFRNYTDEWVLVI